MNIKSFRRSLGIFISTFAFTYLAYAQDWEIVYVPSDINAAHRINILEKRPPQVIFAAERYIPTTGENYYAIIEIDCVANRYRYMAENKSYEVAYSRYQAGRQEQESYDICCQSINYYRKMSVCPPAHP